MSRRVPARVFLAIALPLLLLLATVSLVQGPDLGGVAPIRTAEVGQALVAELGWAAPLPQNRQAIVTSIRLPRILVALLAGAALAIAGTLMQAVFRNPLASPEILGTAQGSALGATVAIVLGLNSHWAPMLPICAIVGALAVTAVVYGIAGGTRGFSVGSLLLAGIAMNTLVGALISFAISSLTYDDWGQGSRILFWLMGDFDKTTAQAVVTVGVVLVVVAGCLLPFLRDMDVMTLEGESARALGVHVPLVRSVLLAAACVLTAVTVAFTGGIAFVGLVVPHMARLIVGPRHRAVVPSAAVLGGVFLVAADYLCRVVVPQSGLRVGVVMSMIGAPFFFYLLVRMRRDRPL